jgi:hypothetical protein
MTRKLLDRMFRFIGIIVVIYLLSIVPWNTRTSDCMDTHLFTREAFELYKSGITEPKFTPTVYPAPEVKTGREFHDWCRTNFYVKRQRPYLAVYTYLDKPGSYTEENDPRIILSIETLTSEDRFNRLKLKRRGFTITGM